MQAAIEHMRHAHPYAPLEEERLRTIIRERSYPIEHVVVYSGGYGPDEEFGLEPY